MHEAVVENRLSVIAIGETAEMKQVGLIARGPAVRTGPGPTEALKRFRDEPVADRPASRVGEKLVTHFDLALRG